MTSFVKWTIAIALGVAVSGYLKSATMKMAKMAVEAQKHQISYGKFSRMLTAPDVAVAGRKNGTRKNFKSDSPAKSHEFQGGLRN